MNPLLLDFPDHFETERLLIRSPQPGDGQAMYDAIIESLDDLKPWMPWATNNVTVAAEEEVARRGQVEFLARENLIMTLWDKTTNTFVGGSGLHRFDWNVPRFEIGYWVRSRLQRKGYITEAVLGITDFAFGQLSAERVEIRMDNKNIRSWRVAERAGFTLEGILRNDARAVDGELRDTRVYSMLRDEWRKQTKLSDAGA